MKDESIEKCELMGHGNHTKYCKNVVHCQHSQPNMMIWDLHF